MKKRRFSHGLKRKNNKGNRILAVATKNISSYNPESYDIEADDHDYETIGLIAFSRPT